MTRQDWLFFLAGPCAILLIWALLPWGRSETWRAGDAPAAAVAELVGYAFEAPPNSRPLLLGRGAEADFRLHGAPVARRAAWLTPPSDGRPFWSVLPAGAGLTLKLLEGPRGERPAGAPAARTADTSVRPWRRKAGRLSRFVPFARPRSEPMAIGCGAPAATVAPVRLHAVQLPAQIAGSEPEVVWLDATDRPAVTSETGVDLLACAGGTVWSRPHQPGSAFGGGECATDLTGWTRVHGCWRSWARLWRGQPTRACAGAATWGASLSAGGDDRLILPWSESSGPGGLWLSMSGPRPSSIRIGVAAAGDGPPATDPAPLEICPAAGTGAGGVAAAIGPLELRDGDLLAIGRTRFLVRSEFPPGEEAAGAGTRRLELYHVRDPRSPGYFRASAGHDAYHPNRRALWTVPSCAGTDKAGTARQETLTLAVEPPETASETAAAAADLAAGDRRRQLQIAAAIRDHGVPHELPGTTRDRAPAAPADGDANEGRSLLSLCTLRGDRELSVRLVADSGTGIGLRTAAGGAAETLTRDQRTIPIGTSGRGPFGVAGDPRELLVDLGGNLLAVAPPSGPRITRRTRTGLAVYLILILALQAWPLTRARIRRRRAEGQAAGIRPVDWPAALATPTLQQAAGIAIAMLLFLGASFHLFLGLHPELVGKPDYLQAFLQGTVVVCVVLAAAAGFSHVPAASPLAGGRGLERRCGAAALAAAAALSAATGWWWWDAAGSAEGAWLSAERDRASTAAAAGPAATGRLLFSTGLLAAAAAAALFLAARLRWSRAAERLARIAVRVPLAGFVALALAGLGLGMAQRSALAFELALAAGLAWYAAVYWAFVRRGRLARNDELRRKAAVMSMASGLLMLFFLAVFFVVGADLPDPVSFASVAIGLAILGGALRLAWQERSTSLLRVVCLWMPASALGMAFASFVLRDMGSVAAWVPALLTGFFLWLVRPEEIENRREEPRKALAHLLLAFGSGLVLLGLLDVFKRIVGGLDWQVLERPQQRLALAEDISYITSGEWITQVRWLASQHDDSLAWVPNVNSDIAVFGLAANLGSGWAIAASMVLLAIAGCAALAADQGLREARAAALDGGDRLRPVLYRLCGLTLGMVCVLLTCQWLVHLATGVVLHLPITGLVFPWISHGNTTHLLYTAAILVPMAAITALSRSQRLSQEIDRVFEDGLLKGGVGPETVPRTRSRTIVDGPRTAPQARLLGRGGRGR